MTTSPKGGPPPRPRFFRRLAASWSIRNALSVASVPQEQVFGLQCFTPDAVALLRATFRRAEANGAVSATLRQLLVEALELPKLREASRPRGSTAR